MTLPSSHDGVLSMVYEAVARTNEDLEPEMRIEARPDEMPVEALIAKDRLARFRLAHSRDRGTRA